MEIIETVRKSIPENDETALSIVKGEIFKYINSRLYKHDIAVSKAVFDIAGNIKKHGGDKENLYIGWLAERVIEWVIGKRKPEKSWIVAIFKCYSSNSLAVLISKGSSKDNRVVAACSAWKGRKEFSFNTLRAEETYFFRDRTAPRSIIDMAKALYYEREIDLRQISVEDCIAIAKCAYSKGVSDTIKGEAI